MTLMVYSSSVLLFFSVLLLLSLFPFIVGYSFDITAAPTQCGLLSLEITGDDGSPPYTALVVPFGSSSDNTTQRTAFSQPFSSASTSFLLPYPTGSRFVIMISDSNGFGTGGTSVPTTIRASSNSSCLSTNPPPKFFSEFLPETFVNQCQSITIGWSPGAQGAVSISLLIPGGQSSRIRAYNAGKLLGGLIGFLWVPNVRAGTSALLVVGDSQGLGTGGSINFTVGNSPTQDATCLDKQSPSSTAGIPAGAVQTNSLGKGRKGGGGGGGGGNGGGGGGSAGGGGGGRGGSKSNHVGAIVGGVVGGVAACAIGGILAFFLVHKYQRRQRPAAHVVDLLPEDAQRDPDHLPEFYQPEPFIVPLSHAADAGSGEAGMERLIVSDVGRRSNALSTTGASGTLSGASGNAVGAGGMGTGTGKRGAGPSQKSPEGMPQLRPVNIVMHEDAGGLPEASESGQVDETETIELPPSYISVRR